MLFYYSFMKSLRSKLDALHHSNHSNSSTKTSTASRIHFHPLLVFQVHQILLTASSYATFLAFAPSHSVYAHLSAPNTGFLANIQCSIPGSKHHWQPPETLPLPFPWHLRKRRPSRNIVRVKRFPPLSFLFCFFDIVFASIIDISRCYHHLAGRKGFDCIAKLYEI